MKNKPAKSFINNIQVSGFIDNYKKSFGDYEIVFKLAPNSTYITTVLKNKNVELILSNDKVKTHVRVLKGYFNFVKER